jgi:prepilin-type N-terminal cleavage/methylation domain-containing protein
MLNKKGVTLIELIVVMVIIAIGAVLVAPNIGAWLPTYRLNSATRDITSTLRSAQMKAVSTNLQYQVSINQAARSYILYRNSGGLIQEGAVQNLPSGITIAGTNNVSFNSNSTSTGGNIILQNPKGSTKSIAISTVTGRIR